MVYTTTSGDRSMFLMPLIRLLNRQMFPLRATHYTYGNGNDPTDRACPPTHPEDETMVTQTINIVITSDTPNDVEAYIRDCIDNADEDWEIESADIVTEGVVTDLLEEVDDEPDDDEEAEERETEKTVEEEGTKQAPGEEPRQEPTGKEF